uniref:Oligomycin sensitivity conferral protein n=1 Tax=Sus scrofa TaxID=9823 RepID=A0A8D1U6V2_PIG
MNLPMSLHLRGHHPGVQCFSTSVVRPFAKLVRLPVQLYGIKGCYATALYYAASEQNKPEQVEKELLRVAQILKEPQMASLKSLSSITAEERFSPLTSNTTNLLAENGHMSNTPGVMPAFPTVSVHRGEVPCTVTTASPLDEATLTKLKMVLKSFLSKDQVMGGMMVPTGEKYVGMSVKHKIWKLSKAMQKIL